MCSGDRVECDDFHGGLDFDLMDLDESGWSGEGQFTKRLIAALAATGAVRALKVEDAPASRADAGFSFISNELFVRFETTTAAVRRRRWSVFRGFGVVPVNVMTLEELESRLAALPDIGPADYMDAGMVQYLRTERVMAPYQTRGYKLIELVRVYESGTVPSRGEP